MAERFGRKPSRGCRLLGMSWTSYAYVSRRPDDSELRQKIRQIAEEKRYFGCPRVYVRLRRQGWTMNYKKVERIYGEEKLSLRRRKRKKHASQLRLEIVRPIRAGQCYAMDFVHDRLAAGRRFKVLTMVDPFTRECPALEVDTSINGLRVTQVLDRIFDSRPLPETIIVDNGPEFSGKVLDEWAFRRGVKLHFIQPGKPVQNAFCESFNGKFRYEFLDAHWFLTLPEARQKCEEHRQEYNNDREHSSLNNLTPMEFIQQLKVTEQTTENIQSLQI